jgi:hypothetical protein
MTNEQAIELKDKLIDRVIEHIKKDIEYSDTTAIEALLTFCPTNNLVSYLPEEEWAEFEQLEKFNS